MGALKNNKILNLILSNIIAKAAKITEKENNVEFMEILVLIGRKFGKNPSEFLMTLQSEKMGVGGYMKL